MLEGGAVIKSARTGQSSRHRCRWQQDNWASLQDKNRADEQAWNRFLNIWGRFIYSYRHLKTKGCHSGLSFLPQTGSNWPLGSRSETIQVYRFICPRSVRHPTWGGAAGPVLVPSSLLSERRRSQDQVHRDRPGPGGHPRPEPREAPITHTR